MAATCCSPLTFSPDVLTTPKVSPRCFDHHYDFPPTLSAPGRCRPECLSIPRLVGGNDVFMTTVAYLRWVDKADLGVQLNTGRGPMSYCRSCGWSVGLLHVSEPTACLEINARYRPDNAIASGLGGMARSVGPPLQYRSARECRPIWFAVSRTCYILADRRIFHLR